MKAGWQTSKLGEVCSFLNRGISPKYLETGGICVLNQKCVRDHRISIEQARRHDADAKSVSPDRLIQLGDVLVNSTGTGTLGRVAQVREQPLEPTTVDSHVTIARPIPNKFFTEFFGYMLRFIEDEIKEAGEGCGGQTELARSILAEKFSVTYPTALPEQQRIVTILDQAFEGIATATANAEKNLANARELFASHMDSTHSQQHAGWKEKTLGEVCDFIGGSQPPKSDFEKNKTADNIRLIQIRDYKSDNHVTYIPKSKARRFCNADDVMIGRYGPPIFQILRGLEGAYNVALMKAVANEAVLSRDYLYYFLKHPTIQNYVIYHSERAAGQSGLNKETLEPYPIWLPPLSEQIRIAEQTRELECECQNLEAIYQQKLNALEELKKSILNQAFTGQLH